MDRLDSGILVFRLKLEFCNCFYEVIYDKALPLPEGLQVVRPSKLIASKPGSWKVRMACIKASNHRPYPLQIFAVRQNYSYRQLQPAIIGSQPYPSGTLLL
jgi:hypothetical protein